MKLSMRERSPAGARRGALLLTVLAACLPGRPVSAAKIHPDAGSTSAAFLKIGTGARAVSMAGAFTAVADDPYALYWNPAGLHQVRHRTISFTHNEYFQDLSQELLLYSVEGERLRFIGAPALRKGTWALGLNYFRVPDDLERRSGLYESDPLNPISPVEGTFGAYDAAFSLGYGAARGPDAAFGAAFKLIRQTIDDESGHGAALDLGAMRSFIWLGGRLFTAGAALQNLGPGIKFVSRRYALPLTLRAGVSHRMPETGALLSLDISKPRDNYPSFALGMEQSLGPRLALRAGYRWRLHGNELGAWSGFSAGMGLALERLSFDYAFSPFGDLGNSHRFTLSFRFGEKPPPSVRPPGPNVLASEKLRAATLHAYSVSARPLKMSPSGVQYHLRGESRTSPVRVLEMKVFARGKAPEVLNMAEGALPEELSARLPPGVRICGSLQLAGAPGNIQGELSMEFLPGGDCAGGEPSLFYLSDRGWEEKRAERLPDPAGNGLFRAVVPQSTHFVIGVGR